MLLKLISTATASSGTGVSLDRYQQIFTLQEAAYLRMSMPLNNKVKYQETVVEIQ